MERLDGKVIILTGAASGIGKATAQSLHAAGAALLLADLDPAGEAVADQISSAGGRARFLRTDVSSEDDVARAVDLALTSFGGLHGAANCAGISTAPVPFAEIDSGDWDRVLGVNLNGMYYCVKHELRAILAAGAGGSIVNVASALGATASPNMGPYVASKHGVVGITRAAAVDYARAGVRVNAVMPGIVDTPMVSNAIATGAYEGFLEAMKAAHPVGRLGRPEEIAAAIVWLLSDAASFVTGATLFADGGFSVP